MPRPIQNRGSYTLRYAWRIFASGPLVCNYTSLGGSILAKTVPRTRGSPATAIHNTRQRPDGLDADTPLEAPHLRMRPVSENRLLQEDRGSCILRYACPILGRGHRWSEMFDGRKAP